MSHVKADNPIPRFYGGDNWWDFIETFKAHPFYKGHSKRSCDQDQFKKIMLLLCINDVGPDYYRLDTDSCQTLDELVDKLTEYFSTSPDNARPPQRSSTTDVIHDCNHCISGTDVSNLDAVTPALADVENLDSPSDDTSSHNVRLGCDIDDDIPTDDELVSSADGAFPANDVLVDYHVDATDTDVISLAGFWPEMAPGEDFQHQGFVGSCDYDDAICQRGQPTEIGRDYGDVTCHREQSTDIGPDSNCESSEHLGLPRVNLSTRKMDNALARSSVPTSRGYYWHSSVSCVRHVCQVDRCIVHDVSTSVARGRSSSADRPTGTPGRKRACHTLGEPGHWRRCPARIL